jgi:serine/threonine protein kinase
MHYCESGDLSKIIVNAAKTKTYISESNIIKWSSQLALAMEYLRECHILHRDIKPGNILLTDNGM